MKKYLLVIGLSFFIISGCSSNSESDEVSKLEKTISSLKKENDALKKQNMQSERINESTEETIEITKEFGLNEEAVIKDASGKEMYSLKIINATTNLNSSDDAYTDGKPDNTIQVTYEYKNINNPESLIILSQFMAAFDTDGKAGKNMNMMDGQTQVSQGRSSQSTVWFVMDGPMQDQDSVEIEYLNDFSLGFEGVAIFKVPLEH